MKCVGYDGRAVLIGGQRRLLLSGAIHRARRAPAMWPRLLEESRRAGLNTIETYVFWEQHEPREAVYGFSGHRDLGLFLDLCKQASIHVILRIGPYVCAETNSGGLRWWLTTKPGLVTRAPNPPFMVAVDRWMKRLFVEIGDRQITRDGPIILAQLENEYANVDKRYGDDGSRYLEWCLACGRAAGLVVPLIICEGAPRGAIATLNGVSVWSRVEAHRKANPRQPALWTEVWTGWYGTRGEPHDLRPTDDITHEALRFLAMGGTGINYYTWHGGTNFDGDAMCLQATTYDIDALLDECGLPTDKPEGLRKHTEVLLRGRRLSPGVLIPGAMPQQVDRVIVWINGRRAGTAPARLQEERITPESFAVSLTVPLGRGEKELSILVNAIGMSKGLLWVNGHGIGRYRQDPARDARQARYTRHPHLVNTGQHRLRITDPVLRPQSIRRAPARAQHESRFRGARGRARGLPFGSAHMRWTPGDSTRGG